MNVEYFRQLFPVTQHAIFLNNAAESPLNIRTKSALDDYIRLALHEPFNKESPRNAIRERLARIFGGTASDYALVTSTGVGIGMVAQGFPWQHGDNVVVPADEHWNNTFPWIALREKGVEVRFVEPGVDERVTPESVACHVDNHTKIVACAAVRFTTGFRADLKRISELAHAHKALFLVDAIQAAGVIPIDIDTLGIDIMSAAAFKWLLGLPGSGFVYINKTARQIISPVLPGMFAAESDFRELRYFPDARKYETGTIAYPLFHAWTAGLDLLTEIGIETIHSRIMILTDRIIDGLVAKKLTVFSPVAQESERSAIISFSVGDSNTNEQLIETLSKNRVIVALRDGRIRVSPNFYNSEEDIDTFLEMIG